MLSGPGVTSMMQSAVVTLSSTVTVAVPTEPGAVYTTVGPKPGETLPPIPETFQLS